jgi:DNA polymerase elongation subunit (family B)
MSKSKNEFLYIINWSFEEDTFNDVTILRLYGYDRQKKSVMVRIEDFTTFCYLELPPTINWVKYASSLSNCIKEKFKSKPLKMELEMKKRLYNAEYKKVEDKYEQVLFPFLKVSFATFSKMRDFIGQSRGGLYIAGLGKVTVNVHCGNNSLTPSIRFIDMFDIPSAGWVKLEQITFVDDVDKETNKQREFIVKHSNITRVPENLVTKLPIVYPCILSFDIETYSSKLVSMPDPDLPQDEVFQIGCTIRTIGGKIIKYILTLKECDEIEDVIVIKCKSERILLTDFAKLIRQHDPDLIIGYNIYGFDYQYIIKRAELRKCVNDFMQQSSINGRVCQKGKIEWESSAFGIQEMTFVDADGRLVFDMLPYMKRSFKLANYRLETVCDEFLKTNKDPLKYRDIFECYEKGDGKSLSMCGKYCVQDSYVVYLLFEKLHVWYDITESANTNQVPMFYLYAKGQQIKMYSQVFAYCYHNNIVMNVPRDLLAERYTGATVLNPIPGIYKNIIPFDFASLYPSIIMAYNIDYTTYISNGQVADEDCDIMRWEEHNACSHDPKMKPIKRKKDATDEDEKKYQVREEKREQKKICKEFHHKFAKASKVGKGVIPTIIETLLTARKQVRKKLEIVSHKYKLISLYLDKQLNDEQNKELEENKNLSDIYKLIKEDTDQSIQKLKQMKQELDVQNSVLDKRQISYKVNANSMYGALGAAKGYLPFVNGAMTITYIGRISIEKAVNYIRTNWDDALVVYGDTDSCFINFKRFENHTPDRFDDIWKFAENVVDKIKQIFPAPMKLEFEGKIYATYFILSKKRYIAQPCDINGVMDKNLYKKGVVLQRRDNCKFLKDIYEHTLWNILNNAEKLRFEDVDIKDIMRHPVVSQTINEIIDYVNDLFKLKYAPKDFVITKGLNRVDYIGKRKPAHASLADKLGKRGITVPVNTRLEYVLINLDKKDKLQEDIIEEFGYFKEHKDVLRIDYFYYLEHQVMKPIDEILSVAFKIPKFMDSHVKLRLNKQMIQKQMKTLFRPRIQVINEIEEEKKEEKNIIKMLLTKKKPVVHNLSGLYCFAKIDKNIDKNESKENYDNIEHNNDDNMTIACVIDHNNKDIIEVYHDLLTDMTIVNSDEHKRYVIKTQFENTHADAGKLVAFVAALRIALKMGYKEVFLDSTLLMTWWSKGKVRKETLEKMDPVKKKYLQECIDLRKNYEEKGGKVIKISEDDNKAKF